MSDFKKENAEVRLPALNYLRDCEVRLNWRCSMNDFKKENAEVRLNYLRDYKVRLLLTRQVDEEQMDKAIKEFMDLPVSERQKMIQGLSYTEGRIERFFAGVEAAEESISEKELSLDSDIAPPKSAILLLHVFYRRKTREGLQGDLEEDFNEALELFGPRVAIWLYWKGVLVSFGPALLHWAARGAIFSKLLEFFHKFVG